MVPVFWCLKFGQLHISVYGPSIRKRIFATEIPHPYFLSLRPLFLQIQNFFAFFDHTPAVVFSQASNVGPPHRNTQNGCQPAVCIFSGHQAPFVQLIKSPMSFIAQNPQLPVGHGAHGDLRSGMHPDIGITDTFEARRSVCQAEIRHFVKAVQELNQCGVDLFGQSHQDYVEFGVHFQRLENFINQRKTDLATEAETALINDLLGRFDFVVSSTKDTNGTFHDLRHGLYFYLKQKKSEKPVDWIVKNFEQIDGDILQSRKQHFIHKRKLEDGDRSHKEKIYHFAALSDRDMNVSTDDLLPWPLTDQFILKAYTPIDLQFQAHFW